MADQPDSTPKPETPAEAPPAKPAGGGGAKMIDVKGMIRQASVRVDVDQLVKQGRKQISLLYDTERQDMYKRTLAYIFCDGHFVNGELVRRGVAHAYRWEPNTRFSKELLELQKMARAEKIGLWSLPPPPPSSVYVTRATEHLFHRPECATARKMPAKARIEFKTRDEAFDTGRKPDPACNP